MKRSDLLRHLEKHGCRFLREGANHTIYLNPANDRITAVERHREIDNNLCRKSASNSESLKFEQTTQVGGFPAGMFAALR